MKVVGLAGAAVAAILLTPATLLVTYHVMSWNIPGHSVPGPLPTPHSTPIGPSDFVRKDLADDAIEHSLAKAAFKLAQEHLPQRHGAEPWKWEYSGSGGVSAPATQWHFIAVALTPSCPDPAQRSGCVVGRPEGIVAVRVVGLPAAERDVLITYRLDEASPQEGTLQLHLVRSVDDWRVTRVDWLD
jgi:hypothetical protein